MRSRRSLAIVIASLGLLSGCEEIESIPGALGFSAQDICARVFVGGESGWKAKHKFAAPFVEPLPLIWHVDIDYNRKKVKVSESLTWQKAVAAYRPGLGCTKLVDLSRSELLAQPFTPTTPPALGPDYWPRGNGGVSPAAANYDQAALSIAFNDLMNERDYNTQGIAMAHNGKMIRKAYGSGYSDASRFTGWSMSKTVTALALGIAQQRVGGFTLDDSASKFYPSWQGTPKEAITVRHILNMESGLQWEEEYGSASTTADLYYGSHDMAAYVASLPQEFTPGTHFEYSSGDTMLLSGIVKQLSGGSLQSNYDFLNNYLLQPVGITSAVMQPDESGTTVGAAHNYMSLEDWLRIGQLILNRGEWQGQQVVPAAWIDEIAKRTPNSGGSYGGQVWTYSADPMAEYGIPEDIILLWGYQHQLMAVIPSRNLVFLRLGVFTGNEDEEQARGYFKALQRVLQTL